MNQQAVSLEYGPNPFSTHLEVNLSEKPTAVRLHNALGQVFSISWDFTNELHLDFPELEKGFYWLTLELTEGPQTILLQKD